VGGRRRRSHLEEIDIAASGGNFAWPHCEGTLPSGCEQAGDIDPIFTYLHSGSGSLGTCIIGGSFAGSAFGTLAGDYVFGDCTSSDVYHATPNAMRNDLAGTPALVSSNAGVPADFVTGPDGAVYYSAEGDGEVRRLAQGPPPPDTLLLGGKKLALKVSPDPSKKHLLALSKDTSVDLGAGNGSTHDPTLGGGSLRVRCTGGGCDTTYPLMNNPPDEGWSYLGASGDNKGYKFKSKVGPIRLVLLKNGTLLKAVGRGALGHTLGADPEPVDVVLQTGSAPRRYCLEFGGTTVFKANAYFTAKDAPTSPGCPP